MGKTLRKFKRIILVLGKAASGKGTAVEIMTNHFPIKGLSSSSWLRALALVEKRPQDGANLKALGDQLRDEHGAGILAELTLREFAAQDIPNVVIDGLRGLKELSPFLNPKSVPHKNVSLIWIDASDELRLERMKRRGRQGDPKTLPELRKFDQRTFPRADQIMQLCKQHGIIIHNAGTIRDLTEAIKNVMEGLQIPEITRIVGSSSPIV